MLKDKFPDYLKEYIYFDNAATSPKPISVIDSISEFYKKYNAPVYRSSYKLADVAIEKFTEYRQNIAKFFNCSTDQIFFTSGTTDSLNQIAYGLSNIIKADDAILTTQIEHHSSLLPLIRLCKEANANLNYISVNKNGELNYSEIDSKVNKNTKIIQFSACSNVTGIKTDITKFVAAAKQVGALTVLDAAQLAPHLKTDFTNLDVDFAALSAHKMYGPTGIGIVYIKNPKLLKPFKLGGGIVLNATMCDYKITPPPNVFFAGTLPNAEIAGFSAATCFYNKYNLYKDVQIDKTFDYLYNELKNLEFIKLIGKKPDIPLVSFNIDNIHPHDVAQFLDSKNICVRTGHHCAKPLHSALNLTATVRASLLHYNTLDEVKKFIIAIKKIKEFFKL